MNKQMTVWKFIAENLQNEIPIMLLYVLESKGSSPGRQGFFMAVNETKHMKGSIGGGIMEHKFIELAREKLKSSAMNSKNDDIQTELKKQIHNKSAGKNQSGMICSGEQTILIYLLHKNDQLQIDRLIRCLENNLNGTLVLSRQGINFIDQLPKKDFSFEMKSEQDWLYTEKIGFKNHLFVIGGGHCALAFSKLMSEMDFYIHLFDTRENLNTIQQNEFVHEMQILDRYEDIQSQITEGDHTYVVIMTFGYRTDDIVLRSVLHKNYKYLGLLGSKNKIQKMFDALRRDGVKKKLLKKIHAPIGLPIKSQTPEEIAVSIAAEIIGIKNR
jgi:xanthine dehydrogenase accessory factor